MKLTILGSGTCVPSVKRASPGLFLEENKLKILIDCGPGALRQIVKAGKDYKDIDLVLLNHLHTDHVSDLFALIQALSWTPDLGSKDNYFHRKEDLYIYAAKGFKKWFNSIQKINKVYPRFNTFNIKVSEFKFEQKFKNIKIETIKGNHNIYSRPMKIFYRNKNFVYSGDTDYDPKLIKLAQNTDLLILECSWPDKYKCSGHLTPDECGQIAAAANAKKLLLIHLYPPMDSYINTIKFSIRKHYKGPVILAKDLMQIKI